MTSHMAKVKGIFKKKNVVVTGGAGFIGSHICERVALDTEARVICIDNLVTGTIMNIEPLLQSPDFKLVRHDINEPLDLAKLPDLQQFEIEFEGIQEIYHCATPTSYMDPKKFAHATVLATSVGTKNVLDMARTYGAKVVHLSSSAIYGDPLPEDKQFNEDYWGFINPVDQRAPYNEGKRFSETLCMVYAVTHGLDIKIARVFSSFGPRMIMAEGRHIPDFVVAAIDNKDIVIYGDQDTSRSYCYIKDMVDGLMKLMEAKDIGPYNIGSDDEHKLSDIAQAVITAVGSKSKVKFEKPLPGMHEQGLPNIKKIKDAIGWFPVIKLEDGLRETIEYMRSVKSNYEQQGLWDSSTLDRKE
jgi:UDP-glucuronate decarboxylase